MMRRHLLTISMLLLPCAALAAPRAKGVPSARPYSAEEIAELNQMSKDLAHFKTASDSYRKTVNSIVRRAYENRRSQMLKKFDSKIKEYESEERTRRIATITLFEDFLRRYPNDPRWTADVIFRLAELYFEKSGDEYLQATDGYENELKRFERKEIATAPAPPTQDFTQTVTLHRRLIREFPSYRLLDGAYYLLGFCLGEMGKTDEGNQALLSLVCSNQYKPPLAPSDVVIKGGGTPLVDGKPQYALAAYESCTPLKAKGRFNAEAWVRIGEYHFDENQLGKAIAAYQKVLAIGVKGNSYYDEALYKLAWTYYRADKFTEAIAHFDKLVIYADKERARTGKAGSEMRPESIQYLGVSFAEEDWDGDQQPDEERGITRLQKFFPASRHQEKHVYEVYRRLGDIYFDTTKYKEAIEVYKLILQIWPYRPTNPDVQDRVITALERQQEHEKAMAERTAFTGLFGKGTEWEKKNRNNPEALKKAREYDEQMLIQAAVFHHNAGRELRKKGIGTSNVELLKRAQQEYAIAAKAYERYLERFPNTKNSYELRFGYANCLYFSSRYLEAAQVYEATRDSNLDNRYQKDAALYTIKSYEQYIKAQIDGGKLKEPPLPTDKMKNPQKIEMPEIYVKLQTSFDTYAKLLPTAADSPRMKYKAAEVSYRHIHFADARKRFEEIYGKYCKDAMAINAAQAILVTYQLEKKRDLDNLQKWATNLSSGQCGGTAGAKHKAGATRLLEGIKFIRAQKLFKTAEDLYNAGKKREAAPWYDKAAAAYLALVDASPKSDDSDKALFNAGVAYEKSMRFDSATKIYERVWQQYPRSKLAGEAVWLSAQNHKRFFNFKNAVTNYLILADGPRFAQNKHRTDAIYNAAQILEYDQSYSRAAQLFLRYAKQPGVKPGDAAEAYFRAGLIYGKMNDFNQMVKVMRDFPDKYGNVAGQKGRAVEALYRIAKVAEKRKMAPTARKYLQRVKQEYSIRRLPPAGDAAEYAAEAAFKLLEEKLTGYLKLHMKKQSLKRLVASEKKMGAKAIALKTDYGQILKYKRARWTLAALYRYGTIYEHFAKKVAEGYRTSPIPRKVKKLGQEAVDIYMGQIDQALEQKVGPLEKESKKLYLECVSRAKQLGVSNVYTEEAEARLNALDPDQYPLLKPAQTATVIE